MPVLKRFTFLLTLGLFILTGCVVPPSLSLNSNSEPSTSQGETSLDLKAYFDVVSMTKQFNAAPRNAVIQVRLRGSTLTESMIIQGISLIANDFYEAEVATIGVLRVELTIQVFDVSQALNSSPTFGDALFMINETETLIGIKLKEARIVLA